MSDGDLSAARRGSPEASTTSTARMPGPPTRNGSHLLVEPSSAAKTGSNGPEIRRAYQPKFTPLGTALIGACAPILFKL